MKRLTTIASTLISLSLTTFGQALNIEKLDSFCNALSSRQMAMGSLTISKDGIVQYRRAMGYSLMDANARVPATIDTRYRIGSVSKTFTAVMIFQLEEEGKLSLSQKLSVFYPGIPNSDKITIAQLLSHKSGLHDYTKDTNFPDWMDKAKTPDEMLQIITAKGIDFEPGVKTDYSSTNYLLLGYIIEKLCKMPYSDALQQRISSRIGLNSTYYGDTISVTRNESASYKYTEKEWKMEKQTSPGIHGGAGSIVSTSGDMIKFMNALFAYQLIKKASLDKMKLVEDSYGMGLFADQYGSRPSLGHNGRIEEFYSALWHFPEERLTIAYCTNGIYFPRKDLLEGVLKICFNEPFQIPFLGLIKFTTKDLDKYTGTYSSNQLPVKVACTKLNGQLQLATNGRAFDVIQVAENYFMHAATGYFFEFIPRNRELLVKETDNVYRFKRDL